MPCRYIKNVVTLQVFPEKCSGCGVCVEVCPHRILSLVDRKMFIKDRDGCMECGACERNCPDGAVTVRSGVGCAQAVLSAKGGNQPCCGEQKGCCCS